MKVVPASARQKREVVVSGDGSVAVNAAIQKISGLGGGVVRLDGLIDLDGHIVMASNVTLEGRGPGTGLRNNTANAYEIQFIGTTPTWYDLADPVNGADQFVLDTASEAANFAAGDYALLKDNGGATAGVDFLKVKTDGVSGTGIVKVFGFIDDTNYALLTATTTAAVVDGLTNAGLASMDVLNAGGGSLTVKVQYAADLSFESVNFSECLMELDHCGQVKVHQCEYGVDVSKTHAAHIQFSDWVVGISFSECIFRDAIGGVISAGTSSALKKVQFLDCSFTGVKRAFDFDPSGSSSKATFRHFQIDRNMVLKGEDPQDGGGIGDFLYLQGYCSMSSISNNVVEISSTGYVLQFTKNVNPSGHQVDIVGNKFDNGDLFFETLTNSTVSNNNLYSGSLTFTAGGYRNAIEGNRGSDLTLNYVYRSQISGNYLNWVYLLGVGGVKASDNHISGNTFTGGLRFSGVCENNVVDGNTFFSTVSLSYVVTDSCPGTIFSNNVVQDSVVYENPAQNDCTIVDNKIDGTLTFLTGTGNKVEQPGHYSIQDNVIRLAAGGSTEINAAITIINGLGGGTLYIDALLDLDGDIAMKSNVKVVGSGPGTGFRNNTANDYDIDFVGATPTYYGIQGPPLLPGDEFITDVAADATNFEVGDYVILRSTGASTSAIEFSKVKVAGDGGTGEVKVYGNINTQGGLLNSASEAAPLKNAVDGAALFNIELVNSSTGSLDVVIQYATNLAFKNLRADTCSFSMDQSGIIKIEDCTFTAATSTTHNIHVQLKTWLAYITMQENFFTNSVYAVKWVENTNAIKALNFADNTVSSQYGLYLYESSPIDLALFDTVVHRNNFTNMQNPDGSALGIAFYTRAHTQYGVFSDNILDLEATGNQIYFYGPAYAGHLYWTITGNTVNGSAMFNQLRSSQILDNYFAVSCGFSEAPNSLVCSGNTFKKTYFYDSGSGAITDLVISNNQFTDKVYMTGAAGRVFENSSISGNIFENDVSLTTHMQNTIFSSNVFKADMTFTTAVANSLDGISFMGNQVTGAFSIATETDHDNWIISGNRFDSTHTQLTGENNRLVPPNQERWDDMRIGTGAFSFFGSNDPTLSDWQPGASGPTFKVYKFVKNDEAFALVQMSHTYKEGSDMYLHLHWTPADRGNEENGALVGWKVDYSLANVGDAFPSGSTADFSDACDGTDDKHQITSSVQVSGTGMTISHMWMLRIYRTDTGADDTWVGTTAAQSPGFLEVDIHYQKDDIGSEEETAKY